MESTGGVVDRGRVRYIEPTNMTFFRDGSFSDMINFPYEDYNMAVDLSIRQVDRYSCGWWKESGEQTDILFSSTAGTISFLGGTRGYQSMTNMDDSYLTTNFTDVSMLTPEGNTSECLGIESINITYNSWFHPQVVIKFIDVRGATVMQPAERNYYRTDDAGLSSELYKSLFSFPYPIFTLKVKGFYGKGVTYKLAVEKTNLEFDSNNGNFIITVNFIGYMFGIYADMPMTYLAIAPYTQEGRAYWRKKIEDGTFTFRDENGFKSTQMLTIPELRLKLAQAASNEEALSVAADGEQIQTDYDEQIASLNSLTREYPFKEWFVDSASPYVYKVVFSKDDMKDIEDDVENFVNLVSAHDYTYNTRYLSSFEHLSHYLKHNNVMQIIEYVKDDSSTDPLSTKYHDDLFGKNLTRYKDSIEPFPNVQEYISKQRGGITNFFLYTFHNEKTDFNYTLFTKKINDEIKELELRKSEKEKEYKSKKNSTIEKVLGFKPSIKNIFDLMFAHMDTFMHCFYSTTKAIKDQLDHNGDERKKSHYRVKDGETDTENEKLKISGGVVDNENDRCHYLPPFAAFYKETNVNNETKNVLRWPGELLNSSDLEEIHFIDDLLGGAEFYNDESADIERMVDAMNSATTESVVSSEAPTPFIDRFIPLTTHDFIYKDEKVNPYMNVKQKVYVGDESVDGDILGIFAMRAFYYLSTNKGEGNKDAKSFGAIEAINLFKAIKDRYSNGFTKFIKKYADDNRNNRNGFIDIITSKDSNQYTSVWQNNAPNLNKNLFRKQGKHLFYDYHKGYEENSTLHKMFPLSFVNFNELMKDYVNELELKDNNNYIDISKEGVGQFSIKDDVSTFKLLETRDYIKNIYTSTEEEFARTKNYLKENKGKYGSRNNDEYGNIKKANRTLREYTNNIESIVGKEIVYKDAIVNASEKSINYNKFKKVLQEGTYKDLEEYYISIPSLIYGSTIFDEDIYLIQDSIKAKAYLFLQTIPIIGNPKIGSIDEESINGITLKAKLLREGSYYWREDNNDAFKFTGINSDGEVVPSRSYIQPSSSQTFMKKNENVELSVSQFNMIYNGDNGVYGNWEPPKGATGDRRKILKKYFEEWATSTNEKNGFAANESRLRDKTLYVADKRKIKYKELEIDELAGSEKRSTEAIESRKLQSFLRDLLFTLCTTLDMYNGADFNDNEVLSCTEDSMKKAFEGFMEELEVIYGQTVKEMESSDGEFARKMAVANTENPFKNTDLKLSTYMSLKSLYDKWLCSPYNGAENTWRLSSERNTESDFDRFIYTDSFYHDIGYKLTINITKVSSWLSSCLPTTNLNTTEGVLGYMGKTLFNFLTEVAQDCGGVILALPQKFGLTDATDMTDMFRPISIQNNWDEDTTTFVFMYAYKPSEHLGSVDSGNKDMNGWSPHGDGVDLTDDEIVGKILSDESPYSIPAFAVTYAKQNQSLFKNVRLSTVSHGVTEAGLAATFNIASKSGDGPRESSLYGQDLYPVFSQYSYECSVEMMGNMQITPLMYFQLNNVPLWKGAYMIKKVSHDITAGNISTTFEGVRINRYAIPLTDDTVILLKDTGSKVNDPSVGYPVGGDNNPTTGNNGMVPKVGHNVDIIGDNNVELTFGDTKPKFNESNITNRKPLICLTPAHGPNTRKRQEWEWSTLLVNEISELLKGYSFYDGTSYSSNIQICNVNGRNAMGKGYSMKETQQLIEKYGSSKVISVVPHWNGAGGNYHITFIDKVSNGPRDDSRKLAECFQTEFLKIKETKQNYNIPNGMMNGDCKVQNFLEDEWDAINKKMIKHTDEAPQLRCACVLTENWFADYPKGCNWSSDKNLKDTTSSGRAWLMSEQGLKTLAQAHANAIKRYIDTLS